MRCANTPREINRLPESSRVPLLLAAQVVEEQRKGAVVLDTRDAERFAQLHIRGAMQLGLVGPFASWAAMLLEPDLDLVIVADEEPHAEEARLRLARVGLERVIAYSLADDARASARLSSAIAPCSWWMFAAELNGFKDTCLAPFLFRCSISVPECN